MLTPARFPVPRLLCAAGLALLSVNRLPGADALPAGWFEWPAVEPLAGSALDLSAMNAARGEQLPRLAVRDGHFVLPDGGRLRLWGANLTSGDAFPRTAAEADLIARTLAKAGVNIARLHHLDNPWGVGTGGSIWPKDRPHRELDPVQLDRLHRLIGALRDQGIYSNLNLKVSKTLVPADGFPESVTQVRDFQKRVDIFDRRMIELQKDYARRLLTTKNPYTGRAPAEDPAIAVVELNNENSVLGFWTRDLGRGLDKLPVEFRSELKGQWNDWLARQYADDGALGRAWAPAAAAGAGSVLPTDGRWDLALKDNVSGTVQAGADATELAIEVTRTTGIDWQAQCSLHGVTVRDGTVYTVEFEARSDRARKFGVGVGLDPAARRDEAWRSFGLLETVDLGREWTTHRLSFAAHSVAGAPAALSLNAGASVGHVWVRHLRLVADAPGAGLQAGQSLAARSVPIPTVPSTRQWADWIRFLAETERAFAEEMRTFLKDELHVQAPIVCSQIDYGGLTGLNREQSMEFADGHAYWQHPEFGAAGMWNPENWSIRNSPQLAAFGDRTFGEYGSLALVRVAGKPYTLSEYDHPAPSEFACEMYPTLATFASRQDWDIIYPFCIGAYGAANADGKLVDFFDQLHHPAKWGQSPFAAAVFRRELVAPAPAAAELHLGSPLWAEQPHADVLWHQLIPQGSLDFLNVRYAVSDRPGAPGATATLSRHTATTEASAPVVLEQAARGRVWIVRTDRAAAVVGYIGGGRIDAGPLHLNVEPFGRDFASVNAFSLDGQTLRESRRILVTVVGRAGNQGTIWNETRTSLGKQWGHGPTIAERVPATITLDGVGARKVYALAPNGSRVREVAAVRQPSGVMFAVGADDRTLHYEVVRP
jgi:hypothetical protein